MSISKLPFRVGMGLDVHRFIEGRPLILGGVEIPYEKGLDGHSDADALLHAITDAILGAIAAGDIGQHFSNTDPRWKDCDSAVFVREAVRLAREKGYRIGNLDSLIMTEKPKMAPVIPAIIKRVAEMLGVNADCCGVKAGTMEKMGFVGREEGIACQAVVTLVLIENEG